MAANGSAPSRISRRLAPWRSSGSAACALRNAAIAASRSPSCSRISPSVNQAGGKIRRQFDRLQQQIGGGGQIALQLQVARKLEAAVGHQIAGGQE